MSEYRSYPSEVRDEVILEHWKEWYNRQETVHCLRCDQKIRNNYGVDYCSPECGLGFVPTSSGQDSK